MVVVMFISCVQLQVTVSGATETEKQKRMLPVAQPKDAWPNIDIYTCLFQFWTSYVGKNKLPVIKDKNSVKCEGQNLVQLCYGPDKNKKKAQFAVCYNTNTRIPEFTGHVIQPGIPEGGGRDGGFREDNSFGGKVAKDADYAANQGPPNPLFDNYDSFTQQFCARGHLTPNADYDHNDPNDPRSYTMVTTNIAPQWQAFNGGNWQELENALRSYATKEGQALYVVTGTSGEATNANGNVIRLNGLVVAPEWYWKAVCDPFHKQSIFFLARNNIGDASTEKFKGCFDKPQTSKRGIITCLSMGEAKALRMEHFQLPKFDSEFCITLLL